MSFKGNPLLEHPEEDKDMPPRLTQLGRRVKIGLMERTKRGSLGYPELLPKLERDGMRNKDLSYENFTHEYQRQIIRAFALADGHCPVLNCEATDKSAPRATVAG